MILISANSCDTAFRQTSFASKIYKSHNFPKKREQPNRTTTTHDCKPISPNSECSFRPSPSSNSWTKTRLKSVIYRRLCRNGFLFNVRILSLLTVGKHCILEWFEISQIEKFSSNAIFWSIFGHFFEIYLTRSSLNMS